MAHHPHRYSAALRWSGNLGSGTLRYDGYGRQFEVQIPGKPVFLGSADASFRGDPSLHNPEDLLLIALSSCHMLSYLALCGRQRISVVDYRDQAEGEMQLRPDGGGQFTGVTLRPRVIVQDAADVGRATDLHEQAHRLCFIANSCNFPIGHEAVVEAAPADATTTPDTGHGEVRP